MAETVHLIVEQGLNKGNRVVVPSEGARLGRSSKNDIVLEDPLLSRHHCRLFFKPGEGLWVTDLGSANGTMVNGTVIAEQRIRVGDAVMIGDTVLKVVCDEASSGAVTATVPKVAAPPTTAASPVVDLGLKSDKEKQDAAPRRSFGGLILVVASVAIAAVIGSWMPRVLLKGKKKPVPKPVVDVVQNLEVEYEKVMASTGNIFRYSLKIATNNVISVQIDDIRNDRHPRKEKQMTGEYARSLAKDIMDAGFFSLSEEYVGVQPDILEQWDLAVTIGRKTHRTRVVNRVEPDAFVAVREKIELAGKNELGLWAMESSPAKLIDMARESYLLGKKYFDEREMKYGNLARALKCFVEADVYLETVEPKPDFYADAVASVTDCKKTLDEKYNDQNFRVGRAMKLGDWEESAKELRILLEMFPDGNDARSQEARKKLLDVEKHLEKKR